MDAITLEWMFLRLAKTLAGDLVFSKKPKVEIITNYCLKFCFSYDSCINKQV